MILQIGDWVRPLDRAVAGEVRCIVFNEDCGIEYGVALPHPKRPGWFRMHLFPAAMLRPIEGARTEHGGDAA